MECTRTLVIIDQALGHEALGIVNRYLRNIKVVEDPTGKGRETYRSERARIHNTLLAERWPVMLSIYQEMIVKPDELQMTSRPLNIHPSRPEIPGMYYDTGPLISDSESAGMQGGTLHFMTEGIDQGPLIRVLEAPVAEGYRYPEVRRRNQEFCLELLEWTCSAIVRSDGLEAFDRKLSQEIAQLQNRRWGTYIDTPTRDRRLLALHQQDPTHPALVGNKKFEKVLRRSAVSRGVV